MAESLASMEEATDKGKRFRLVVKKGDDQAAKLEVEMKVGRDADNRPASTFINPEVVAGSDFKFRERSQASPKLTVVRDLQRVLLQRLADLDCQVTPPKVTKGTFQDAKRLFGADFKEKVKLRSPGKHAGTFHLLQFDPNLSSAEVWCRHPSCQNRNPNAKQRDNKRDLYLCLTHMDELKSQIARILARKRDIYREAFSLSIDDHEQEDLREYTSLIGLLEVIYFAEEKSSGVLDVKSRMIQEAILNVRNFLIITGTVLNPDINNLGLALPPVLETLELLLETPGSTMLLSLGLMYILKEVTVLILSSFGVIYSWISKTLATSDALMGAAMGGCMGAALPAVMQGDAWQVVAGAATGAVSGCLLGSGYSKAKEELRKQKLRAVYTKNKTERKPVYDFQGGGAGGFQMQLG